MKRLAPAMMFRKNIYSQNGEDGILQELLRRLPSRTYWACEFGTLDGKEYSNTFRLVEREGYNAVYIEQDDAYYKQLLTTCKDYPTILPLHRSVGYEGEDRLDMILATTSIPKDFDILSIDIDSYDYQVWKAVTEYSPRIVVIEINSSIPPTIPDHIHGEKGADGTSFLPMLRLGKSKGYTLICHTGNMIFVRNDLAHLYTDLLIPAENCYTSNWFFS
jgi:hypothetical protein